jgi:hypothetical protein
MYRRPKFLEILDEIRVEMSREADYDVDLFAEMIRAGAGQAKHLGGPKGDSVKVRTVVIDELGENRGQRAKIKK